MSLYSNRVLQDNPVLYFHNDIYGVNNIGSRTPAITTGGSTTFPATGGVTNTPYMNNPGEALNNAGYGFEYSDPTATFDDRAFTISGWINIPYSMAQAYSASIAHLLHFGTTQYGIWLQNFSQHIRVEGFFGASVVGLIGNVTNSADFDKWVHVAITMDSTNLKLYINGSLSDTATSPSSLPLDSLVKYWGKYRTGGWGTINGATGKFDEWAVFNTTLSSTTIAEHYAAGFGIQFETTPATASVLFVDPTLSVSSTIIETPATASATSGDHYNSTFDVFTLLDGALSSLNLEQWYKFNDPRNITNYGTGGSTGYIYSTGATNNITAGIQGSGALRINGGSDFVYTIGTTATSTEFTDDDFSLGFWVKKTTAEFANIFIAANSGFTEYLLIEWTDAGHLLVNARLNNSDHEIETTADYTDGNWHYVAVRKSGNTMQMWVDNVSQGTETVNQSMSGFVVNQFGGGADGPTEQMYISHFYIGTSANITSTEIALLYEFGLGTVQASAAMVDATFSRNDPFNNYVEGKGPKFYFKMDEATGVPVNTGSVPLVLTQQGTSVTRNISSPCNKSYMFTNRDTQFNGAWSAPSGTFSTDNKQTLVVYARYEAAGINAIAGTAAFEGGSGTGMFLQQQANGTMRLRSSNGATTEDATSTVSYADDEYHMFVGVKNGSDLILYVDGVQAAINTSATHTFSDAGQLAVGGPPGQAPASASRTLIIDEVAVFNTAFTAQEAFEIYQAIDWEMDWAAIAEIIDPTVDTGFGPTIAEPAMLASAELPKVFPFIPPMTSEAILLQPNFEAIDNTDNLAEPMEASAQGENPGWNIGENNAVLHMDASASFPIPRVLIPGFWNASPMIASPAEMVEPAISSTLGALIKSQSLNAKAFFALPPAYYLVTDDLWYSALLNIDYQSDSDEGLLTFFNTSNDIYLGGEYDGWAASNNRSPLRANYGYNLYDSPLPVATAGYYDSTNRKALNLRNIALEKGDRETPVATWTMELMIQTTKKNQFITSAFYGGDPSSSVSRKKRTGIRLKDGKIAFTGLIDSTLGMLNSNTEIQFTGFKDIADGEWHHVIIQRRGDGVDQFNPRMQVWIDGELDIQRFGAFAYTPGQIGFNSNDPDAYSDFNISAISINRGSFVLEREVYINYLASFGIIPVSAPVATATAEIGQGSRAAGNRPRALMLYFWPTTSAQGSERFPGFTSSETSDQLTTLDYFTKPPQDYEGWDVFPVDITGRWVSDLVKPEAYGIENIGSTNFIKDVTPFGRPGRADIALVNTAGTFKDPITDAARYIDLINDIDLSKFDMIFFKNYPNESREKDAFSGSEVVDAYFNLRESKLFEDFLKTLRAAVDTGLSLMVATPQLALDLKIVDRVELVPDMDDNLPTDPYAPTQMFGIPEAASLPVPPEYSPPLGWEDTWKNNRTRIVNTHPNITDYPALVKTQQAFWRSTDEFRWGGADRVFVKYEHKDALAVGDEFVISTTGVTGRNNLRGYFATPFENVKAGKIITAFANTIRRGLDEIENPYRNYAQSIIVEPGDVLDGTQVGGKIFVNFTEEINKCQESGSIELISDYWINYAYDNGAISLEDRDALLLQPVVTTEAPYWSLNGMHLLQQSGQEFTLDTNLDRAGLQKAPVKVRKVSKNGGLSFRTVPSGSVFFSVEFSWQYPMAGFEVPSMPTRGFRWLSNREVLEGTVLRPQAFAASAEMPNAAGVPDRQIEFKAQAMVATATIEETEFSSGERKVNVLPMTATATIVKPGSTIGAPAMIANAKMFDDSRSSVASEDQVVLYLMHTDPILYIREDVIK
jgi:hypothetical protein